MFYRAKGGSFGLKSQCFTAKKEVNFELKSQCFIAKKGCCSKIGGHFLNWRTRMGTTFSSECGNWGFTVLYGDNWPNPA